MIRVAIIGSGGIAHARHIPNIIASEKAELRGVYNRNYSHSAKDAVAFDCKAYKSIDELLSDDKVDAVIIATPATTHCDYALKVLAAKKHLLCEKPMSVTVSDALKIKEAAEKAGVKFMVSHNQRYYPPHMKAKELLDAGVIGQVYNIRSNLGLYLPLCDPNPANNGAGNEVLCHRIDLHHYLLGSYVEGVFARLTKLDENGKNVHVLEGEDTAMAIMQYQNGVVANFVASRESHNGNDRMTKIFGSKGSITLYGQHSHVRVELESGEVADYNLPLVPSQREVEKTKIDEAFFSCIDDNLAVPISATDGLWVIKVLEALYRSNEEERYIKIN